MIANLASLAPRMRPWSLLALSLPMLAAMVAPCLAQEAQGAEAVASDAKPSSLQFVADNDATLAEHYPTLRALVVARGNCVVFEYYRKDINAETLSPVYSVAKSVLAILVGIAIDRGYLRLDQKLSELLPETVGDDVDPHVREVTIRDLLTMTAGFDPSEGWAYTSKIRVPATEAWRWMLDSPMKYQPGTHFNCDYLEPDLLSVVLTRAIKQDAATLLNAIFSARSTSKTTVGFPTQTDIWRALLHFLSLRATWRRSAPSTSNTADGATSKSFRRISFATRRPNTMRAVLPCTPPTVTSGE